MDFIVKKATSDALKEKAFAIRREVFIEEQKVNPEEEFDEFEDESHHFVALDQRNEPIGASRWRRTSKGIKLERFAVKQKWRGQGLGSALVDSTLNDIASYAKPGTYLYMHSQLDAVPLYAKFHFQKQGEQFEECEILHYLMWKNL